MAKAKVKMQIRDNIYNKEKDAPMDYVFENVFKLKDREWTTVMSAKQLAKMWYEGKIKYQSDAQRGITLKRNKNGKLEEKAVYSLDNIKSIRNSIVEGTYHPDELTLNLLKDGRDEIVIEDNNMVASGILVVNDGQHRLKALSEIYTSNKIAGENIVNLDELYFSVKITNYTTEESGLLFYQLTKGLKISKSLAESFNKRDSINKIVFDLNRGILKDKIDTIKTNITASDIIHLTTFSTMTSAIRDSYGQIDDEIMEKQVSDFLNVFFEKLISTFPELINDEERKRSKEYNMICENFMMYGWIEISQILYCNRFDGEKWIQQLQNMDKINYDKLINGELNPIWRQVLRLGENGKAYIINSKSTRQVLRRIIREQFYLAQSL